MKTLTEMQTPACPPGSCFPRVCLSSAGFFLVIILLNLLLTPAVQSASVIEFADSAPQVYENHSETTSALIFANNADFPSDAWASYYGKIINLNRSGDTNDCASVELFSSGGTATADSDFKPIRVTVQFAAGVTQRAVFLFIHQDSLRETKETVELRLADPAGCSTGEVVLGARRNAVVTILEDTFPLTWVARETGSDAPLYAVTYANNQFVAVGAGIFTSPDGAAWTRRYGGDSDLFDALYGNGQFVVVGGRAASFFGDAESTAIITSPDGILWTPRTVGTTNVLRSIAYGSGRFVAVGSGLTPDHRHLLLASPDGITWSERASPRNRDLTSIAFGDGQFLAGGPCNLISSTNGLDWTDRFVPALNTCSFSSGLPMHIAFGAGRWVVVGHYLTGCGAQICPGIGTSGHLVGVSSNLVEWSLSGMGSAGTSARVRYLNGNFVSAGGGACCYLFSYAFANSPDGMAWSGGHVVTEYPHRFRDIAWGNGSYVAISDAGTVLHAVVNRPPSTFANVSPLFVMSQAETNLFVLAPNNVATKIVLDGSRSSDPDNDPLQFFWYSDGQTNALATGAVVTHPFAIGAHTVMLVVSDGQDMVTAQVHFEVITPAAAVGQVVQFLQEAKLTREQPLMVSLESAQSSFYRGNIIAALNQLSVFQNKVRAQIAPWNALLANEFISASQNIIDAVVEYAERSESAVSYGLRKR